jgi:hypothetical protein
MQERRPLQACGAFVCGWLRDLLDGGVCVRRPAPGDYGHWETLSVALALPRGAKDLLRDAAMRRLGAGLGLQASVEGKNLNRAGILLVGHFGQGRSGKVSQVRDVSIPLHRSHPGHAPVPTLSQMLPMRSRSISYLFVRACCSGRRRRGARKEAQVAVGTRRGKE